MRGADRVVRGVYVKVMTKGGSPTTLRRPLQHIYTLEVRCETVESPANVEADHNMTGGEPDDPTTDHSASRRPVRRAATHARDRILSLAIED